LTNILILPAAVQGEILHQGRQAVLMDFPGHADPMLSNDARGKWRAAIPSW